MYGQLDANEARQARGQVRWEVERNQDPNKAAMTYADLLATSITVYGEIDHYWLRCFALANRLASFRSAARRK